MILCKGLLEKYCCDPTIIWVECPELGNRKKLCNMHGSIGNIILWIALMVGYSPWQNAIRLLKQMECKGILPNKRPAWTSSEHEQQMELLTRTNKSMMRLQGRGCRKMTLC